MTLNSIAVFCASSPGINPLFMQAAHAVGATLAQRKITLIYGGGCVGLMGAVADGALAAGGKVVGVIPRHLIEKEVGHKGIAELITVESMHERKTLMAARAAAFIALPGGFGTLEELAEILTWSQLGLHTKPVGLLNVAGFYTPLLKLLDDMVSSAFLKPKNRALLLASDSLEDLLTRMHAWTPEYHPKWITPKES